MLHALNDEIIVMSYAQTSVKFVARAETVEIANDKRYIFELSQPLLTD